MNIGVIGFGKRVSGLCKTMINNFPGLRVTTVADSYREYAEAKVDRSGLDRKSIKWYDRAEQMLDAEQFDGIIIGTRCDEHTKYAVMALERNIPIFLEKPVSTTYEQLYSLKRAADASGTSGVVSFPLRVTGHAKRAKEIIDSGVLGTISQVQAVNNVPYGRVYYKSWFRDDSVTGGMFLQKSTHDIDCINYLLGMKPVKLCAMESKMVFRGDKTAGLICERCDEYKTCYESTYFIENQYKDGYNVGNFCSFGVDTGNHDSGSVLLLYENGLHACYTQNFVARAEARERSIRIIGHKATLVFDWDTNLLKVFAHDAPKTETYKIKPEPGGHFGGDFILLQNFIEVMRGGQSVCSLQDGMTSAFICLKAAESAKKCEFLNIEDF